MTDTCIDLNLNLRKLGSYSNKDQDFAPEEKRNDGHQGGGGKDDLHPLVVVHLRPPDAGLPAAGGHLAPPLVVCGEAVEDGALRVTHTSDADA